MNYISMLRTVLGILCESICKASTGCFTLKNTQLFLLHIRYWDISNAVQLFVFVRRAGLRATDHIYSAVNDDLLGENPPTARL